MLVKPAYQGQSRGSVVAINKVSESDVRRRGWLMSPKNRPGGLNGSKAFPKIVTHYANKEHPEHCFERLFKVYFTLSSKLQI